MNKPSGMLVTLLMLFAASIVIANAIAAKLFVVFGVVMTVGAIVYPLTFLLTDVLNEVYGKRVARLAVWGGFAASVLLVLLTQIAIRLEVAPFMPEMGKSFEMVFGGVWRIVAASMAAYLIAQHHDIWAFQFWKAKTRGKHLWLRNNASTMVSQCIDTAVFVLIAFAGIFPWPVIGEMIVAQSLLKICIAFLETPLAYGLVGWARRVEKSA